MVTTTIQLQPDRRSIFTRLQLDRTTTIRRPTLRLKAYIQCELLHWGRNEQAVRELGRQNMPRPCKLTFDLESGVRVTCGVGYLCANFSLHRPLCSRDLGPMYATDRRQTRIIA